MARTNENYLRWKFGKSIAMGYSTNARFIEKGQETGIQLEANESAIVRITLDTDGTSVFLTNLRLVRDNQTLVRFADVIKCIWIDRDSETAAKLKHEKFHRVLFDLRDGGEVQIEGLGQAVFPLLNFFWNKLSLGK